MYVLSCPIFAHRTEHSVVNCILLIPITLAFTPDSGLCIITGSLDLGGSCSAVEPQLTVLSLGSSPFRGSVLGAWLDAQNAGATTSDVCESILS